MSLDDLALNARLIVAGFAGGVVNVFATGEKDPRKIAGALISGLLVANYLGDFFAHWLGALTGGVVSETGAGFIVGCCAISLVNRVAAALVRRFARDQTRDEEERSR